MFCVSQDSPIVKNKSVKRISYGTLSFATRQLSCFNVFHELFYLNGKKIVSIHLDEFLTPLCLAYWIMCDGSKQNQGLYLNTYGFE